MSISKNTIVGTCTRRLRNRYGSWLVVLAISVGYLDGQVSAQGTLDSLGDMIPTTQLDTPVDDLMRLATTYADALKELKVARLSIQTIQSLRPNAVVTNLEMQIATLNLEAAEQKVKVLRAIAEKQLAAAQDKLEIVRYLENEFGAADENGGRINQRSYVRVQDEATVEILKMILAMK